MCKKIWDESAYRYMADAEYYFRNVSESRQQNKQLLRDKNGIYYKKISEYDMPWDLREFPVYMNLKDGSLHAGNSEVFRAIPDSYSDFVRPQVPYEGIINSIPNYGETLSRTNVYSSGINAQAAEAAEQSPSVEKRTTPKIFDTEFDEDPAKDFHVN